MRLSACVRLLCRVWCGGVCVHHRRESVRELLDEAASGLDAIVELRTAVTQLHLVVQALHGEGGNTAQWEERGMSTR